MKVEILEPLKYKKKRHEIGVKIEMDNKTAEIQIAKGNVKKVGKESKAPAKDADKKPDKKAETPPNELDDKSYQEIIALATKLGHEKAQGTSKAGLIEFIEGKQKKG